MGYSPRAGRKLAARLAFAAGAALLAAGFIASGQLCFTLCVSRAEGSPGPVPGGEPQFSSERVAWRERYYAGERALVTRDGVTLTADYYVPESETNRWVLALNCYQNRVMYLEDFCKLMQERGFHVLAADMRARGRSGGEYMGMAVTDKRDILDWLRYIEKADPQAQVLLYGFSGGGTAALATAPDLPACVRGIVTDSAFARSKDEVRRILKNAGLPAFPFVLAGELTAYAKAGFWLSAGNAASGAGGSKLPLLLIHGAEDTYADPAALDTLYNASASSAKTKLLIPGAGHCLAMSENPESYWQAADAFINYWLPPPPSAPGESDEG
ncbi:MAG: lysophospholipase [Oscillospiraceae bacterium]|nr:lysophospholipase [Oscillospiraceae bacterium]